MRQLAAEPAFRDGVLRCVRCSICVPHCPSYAVFRNEADSPRGRVQLLRAAIEGRVPAAAIEPHLDRCLGCRACEDVCPSGVPYGALLDRAREELAPSPHAAGRKRLARFFLDRVLAQPEQIAMASRLLRLAQWLRLDRLARWLARPLAPRAARRLALLPRIAGAPFDARDAPRPEAPTTAFHAGCIMATALGDVQRAALRALEAAGHAPAVPDGQRCCGALHQHAGLREEARALARDTIDAFERAPGVPICTTSAGCALAMKEYGRLLADDPAYAARAAAVAGRVRDLAELVGDRARAPARRLAVQEACHHWNVQRLRGGAAAVLRRGGAEVVALPRGAGCCGAAGLWSAHEPEAAWRLLQPLLDAIEASGCDAVVTSNPGCLFHLRAGLAARGSRVRALHLAEVLDPDSALHDDERDDDERASAARA